LNNGSFSVKRIAWKDTSLINICDSDLLGKTARDSKLSMHISEDYFGGELVDGGEALRLMKSSTIVSLAGGKAVKMAVENKLAAKEAVRVVGDVPFLMIYKFFY
jgi:hypothetical protein